MRFFYLVFFLFVLSGVLSFALDDPSQPLNFSSSHTYGGTVSSLNNDPNFQLASQALDRKIPAKINSGNIKITAKGADINYRSSPSPVTLSSNSLTYNSDHTVIEVENGKLDWDVSRVC